MNYILVIDIQTSSNGHGVTSQGGDWCQEEGSGVNCEFVAGRLPLAGRLPHRVAEFVTGRPPLAENGNDVQ